MCLLCLCFFPAPHTFMTRNCKNQAMRGGDQNIGISCLGNCTFDTKLLSSLPISRRKQSNILLCAMVISLGLRVCHSHIELVATLNQFYLRWWFSPWFPCKTSIQGEPSNKNTPRTRFRMGQGSPSNETDKGGPVRIDSTKCVIGSFLLFNQKTPASA